MTEIAPRESTTLTNTTTGEVIDCSDLRKAGEWLRDLRRMKLQIDDQIKAIEDIALAEMARRGQGTVREGRIQLERQGGPKAEYDLEVLHELLDAGLPPDRYDEAIKRTYTEKADARVLKQLASANETYARIIERAWREVPRRTWIKVTGGSS